MEITDRFMCLQVVWREEDSGKVSGCLMSAVGWRCNDPCLSPAGGVGGRADEQDDGSG